MVGTGFELLIIMKIQFLIFKTRTATTINRQGLILPEKLPESLMLFFCHSIIFRGFCLHQNIVKIQFCVKELNRNSNSHSLLQEELEPF